MTTGKTIALTQRTFVDKVMSLLFNMLSRLVIAFLPRSQHLLISWLQSPSAVILEPPKIKSLVVSIVSPTICREVMGLEKVLKAKRRRIDAFELWCWRRPEKAMAPHSSTLAWKIPWTEEPGRLQSMGSLRSRTRLSKFTFIFHFPALEKEMATHFSVLAWRIPGTGEPGGLLSLGLHRVGHD